MLTGFSDFSGMDVNPQKGRSRIPSWNTPSRNLATEGIEKAMDRSFG